MSATILTFEASLEVVNNLDGVASLQHRDRESILRDALVQYLASDREISATVEEGVQQADAGELIDHDVIEARMAAWKHQMTSK